MVEIYCPRCAWHPESASRWSCAPAIGGCGHIWNTFDTRGICPRCRWHWQITQCFACLQYSPHEQWYHDPNPLDRASDAEKSDEERAKAGVTVEPA